MGKRDKKLAFPSKLSDMERRAASGMDALGREIQMRHAIELNAHNQDWAAMMAEIAEAHGLPRDCWEQGFGIDMGEWEIVRMEGFEEAAVND